MQLEFLYLCNPEKNTKCTKESCQMGMCRMTFNPEYSKDGKKYIFDDAINDFREANMDEIAIVAYNHNPDFKLYVDKYIKSNGLTFEEAIDHKIVNLYLEYTQENSQK